MKLTNTLGLLVLMCTLFVGCSNSGPTITVAGSTTVPTPTVPPTAVSSRFVLLWDGSPEEAIPVSTNSNGTTDLLYAHDGVPAGTYTILVVFRVNYASGATSMQVLKTGTVNVVDTGSGLESTITWEEGSGGPGAPGGP